MDTAEAIEAIESVVVDGDMQPVARDLAIAGLELLRTERMRLLDHATQRGIESQELHAENEKLRSHLTEWQDAVTRAYGENCPPDEKHCACVAVLRGDVERMRAELDAKRTTIDRLHELCHKSLHTLLSVGDALNWPDEVEDVIAELRKTLGR